MGKFCEQCGSELKNKNAKFCDKCGARVRDNVNTMNNNTPQIICPKCSSKIPMGQNVCMNCGTALEDNKIAVIIGYIVAFIFPIFDLIPGIYLLTRNNGKAKTQGLIICVMSIVLTVFTMNLLILDNPEFYFIIYILFTISGVYLWVNDIELIS